MNHRIRSFRPIAALALTCALMLVPGAASAFAAESADIDQCANGPLTAPVSCLGAQWQNGNLNGNQAHFLEGDSIPYRAKLDGLTTGGLYTLQFEWDVTKGGQHALDYITSFDRTEKTSAAATMDPSNPTQVLYANNNNACDGFLAGCVMNSPTSTANIPIDPYVNGKGIHPGSDGTTGTSDDNSTTNYGQIKAWGASGLAIVNPGSPYTNSGDVAGDASTSISVSFVASGPKAVIAWGGHIAMRTDWFPEPSAIAIDGSPYHMRLINMNPPDHLGQQDRSLKTDAVIFPAHVTLIKDVRSNGQSSYTNAQSFPFTSSGLTPTSFSLADNGTAGANTQTFGGNLTTFGSRSFTEGANPSALWSFTGVVNCTNTDGFTSAVTQLTLNAGTRTVPFTLDEGDTVTCTYVNAFTPATPSLTTTASADVTLLKSGTQPQIRDVAHFDGFGTATGTINFKLYNNETCTGTPLNGATGEDVTVNGDADYNSSWYTPTAVGTYHWVATFTSTDANNSNAGPTACLDPDEDVVVSPAVPSLTTTASADVTLLKSGTQPTISDTAHFDGYPGATGTINFKLYDNETCTGTPVNGATGQNATATVNGDGDYFSPPFTPTHVGTYHWVATFTSTDPENTNAGPTACLDSAEDVVVHPATPSLTTTASADVTLVKSGTQPTITDTAHFDGYPGATGTINFKLYDNETCTGTPVNGATGQNATSAVNGDGDYTSPPFTPTHVGTYHWVATFTSTDAENTDAGPTACLDSAEDVVVHPATPSLTTTASATVEVGGDIHDTAHFDGYPGATGTITFKLYGNDTCTGTPLNGANGQDVSVNDDGNYDSPDYTTTSVGTYHWVATFTSTDPENTNAGPTACLDEDEDVTVTPRNPVVHTQVSSARIGLGHSVSDTATLTGDYNAGGTVSFDVYKTDAAEPVCDETTLVGSLGPVQKSGSSWDSGAFTPESVGHYEFVAHYHGDANNNSADGGCGDANEGVDVVAVSVNVLKDPDQDHAYDGDKITFTIKATNTGTDSLKDVTLVDHLVGTSHSCETVTGPTGDDGNGTLDPGETWSYKCTVTVVHGEEIDKNIVNTAHITGTTVTGGDSVTSNEDDAKTPILHPAINIDKSGPASANVGDKVSYALVVTNPGDDPFVGSTVKVADDKCNGDPVTLVARGGDKTPNTLDPGDVWTYFCSVQSAAGDTDIHNVATVTGCDRFDKCATDDDDADTVLQAQLLLPERIVPGQARLAGPTGCVAKAFSARIRGSKIATVTFRLDGKVVKRVTNRSKAQLISLRVNPKKLKIGVHRLVVTVTFEAGSGTKPKTMRLSFQRCAKKLVAPKFTG